MKPKAIILTLLTSVSAFAGSATAPIESPQTPAEVSSWEVRGALYGWAESFEGDVGIRGLTAPLDIAFEDILENLDIAFMGALEVGRDRWSFLADLNLITSDAQIAVHNSQRVVGTTIVRLT